MSIYSELNNSDNWNGTVLAVMLLAGCFGAMLPVWMRVDPSAADSAPVAGKLTEEAGDDGRPLLTPSVSAWKVNASLVVMTIISCGCLIAFSLFWELYASVAALVIFFASWQFINVVFYARVATFVSESSAVYSQLVRNYRRRSDVDGRERLGSSEIEVGRSSDSPGPNRLSGSFGVSSSHPTLAADRDGESPSSLPAHETSSVEREQPLAEELPPYSVSIIFLVTASVLFQVIVQIILFSSLQLSLQTVSVVLTLLFCALSFVYCVDVARFHCTQPVAETR